MANDEPTQPETVSNAVANYLTMTAPRTRVPKDRPRRRVEQELATRPLLDNRDLGLEEGNDFA
jgi:hypothetical protein